MDWNRCIISQSDNKNLLDPSKTLNPRVCGYTLLRGRKCTAKKNNSRSELFKIRR